MRERSRLSPAEIAEIDKGYRKRLRVLLSLDEMISELVEGLEASGELENTYVLFSSDNGYHMGEHRLRPDKEMAYEEDVRVPLIARPQRARRPDGGPARAEQGLRAGLLAALGGVPAPSFMDGRSLAPLLTGQGQASSEIWRSAFFVEHWPANGSTQSGGYYEGVRTEEEKYVRYGNGERELYDLAADPYELENINSNVDPDLEQRLEARLEDLRDCTGEICRAAENGP